MSGFSIGFGIVDMAANWRPKEGVTIFESLDNMVDNFCNFLPISISLLSVLSSAASAQHTVTD